MGLGSRIQAWGSGLRVAGVRFSLQGVGFGVWGSGFRVWGWVRIKGSLGCKVMLYAGRFYLEICAGYQC